jgi:hypothetical protein
LPGCDHKTAAHLDADALTGRQLMSTEASSPFA